MAGILSFGAYVPRMRLQKSAIHEGNRWFAPNLGGLAKGEKAVANWDEDAVTMAVEAARDCLGDADRGDLRAVTMASTSFPFADRQNAGIVKEALNLPDDVATLDVGLSQKAGTGALLQALRGVDALGGPMLLVASEKRRAKPASEDEMRNGDAAVALTLGTGDGVARFVGAASVSADLVDHFRVDGEDFDYGWEARWVRDEGYAKLAGRAIRSVLEAQSVDPQRIAHLIVGIPDDKVGALLARQAGIPAEAVRDGLSRSLGFAGTAHPLVLLAHTLESAKAGELILVLGFGQGADAILLEATGVDRNGATSGVTQALARGVKEANYLKYLTFAGHLSLDLGKRAEFTQKPVLTALYRNRKAVLGLVGGRCTRTGTVQFPATRLSVNQNEAALDTQEDFPLADKPASILTFTADRLAFTLDPPNYYGMVEFEGGGRMLCEFTDVDPELVAVGAPMRMMFRIKGVDDRSGFVNYFWKAVPIAPKT